MNETKGHVTIPLAAYNEMRDRIKELEGEVRDRDYELNSFKNLLSVLKVNPQIWSSADISDIWVLREESIFDSYVRYNIRFAVPRSVVTGLKDEESKLT